ncbi:peptidyl-tRNA hydrolase protein 1 [Entomortierella lignicola]|nr:peptidyl-tRNA hydrolase protein 1 [Entomortierella lignicola]
MAASIKHILVVGLGNHTHPGTRHNVGMMVVDSIAKRYNAQWERMNAWQSEVATFTTTFSMKKKKPYQEPKSRLPAITPATTATTEAKPPAGGKVDALTDIPADVPTPVVRIKPPVEYETIDLKITLLKPLQLMNVSGNSVSRAVKGLGIKVSDVLVIHDDMERDIGKISFKNLGSANGHNGVKSCIKSLNTQHFKRLRIGIGRPESSSRSSDFIAEYVLGKFKPFEIKQLEELVYDKAGDEIIRTTVHPSTPAIRARS